MSPSTALRKSCLPQRPSALAFEVIGFRNVTVGFALEDFFAAEVTPDNNDIESASFQGGFRLVARLAGLRRGAIGS